MELHCLQPIKILTLLYYTTLLLFATVMAAIAAFFAASAVMFSAISVNCLVFYNFIVFRRFRRWNELHFDGKRCKFC